MRTGFDRVLITPRATLVPRSTVIGVDVHERELAPDTHLLTLAGDVDLYAAPELKEQIDRALEHGTRWLVVEFANGTIVDSTILGVLLGAQRQLQARDGSIRLVCSDERLIRILTITGLDRKLPIYVRVGDAVGPMAGNGEP